MRFVILLSVLFVSASQSVMGEQSGDWTYSVENNQATITGYNGAGGALVIPSTVGGYAVGKIGTSAFYGNASLISIIIPNGVSTIETYAFKDCISLTSAIIPNSVTIIEWEAFRGCYSLTNINIPNSVTYIGNLAFELCVSLTEVTIPGSVREMGVGIFRGCSGLTKATVNTGVTILGGGTFAECTSLVSVSLPDGLEMFSGLNMFNGCSNLASITIPSSVTFLGGVSFARCPNLTKVLFLGNAPTAASSLFALTPATVFYLCGTTGWDTTFYGRPTQMITAKDIIQTPEIVGLYSNGQYTSQYESGQQSVLSSPNSYSLYTANQIQNMAFGDLVLTKNSNGSFTLNYDIEQSTDLQNWTTYAPLSTPLTGLPADKAFVRIKAKQ
jgi:hypothetical protein